MRSILNDLSYQFWVIWCGRAEEFFKRATRVEPPDANSLNRYAIFLWLARNDLVAAEETFLRSVEVDPSNPYYASCYANFLWHTGGKDTCFPLWC